MHAPRLFDPTADYPEFEHPQANRTLPQVWRESVLPFIRYQEPDPDRFLRKNGSWYRIALRQWSAIMGEIPVGAIDYKALARWRDAASRVLKSDGDPVSPETVRRNWRYLRAILKRIQLLGIIQTVPSVKMPRVDRRPEDAPPVVLTETWSQLIGGASAWHFSTDPRVPGPVVGRGTIILLWSTGLRHSDLFALRWEDVYDAPHCPVRIGARLRHPHGWIYTIASKTKKPALIPIAGPLRSWLDSTARLLRGRPAGPLLPTGNPSPQSRDGHRRQYCREAMHDAAGLRYVYAFHELRAGANEVWNDAEPDAGEWLLQHAANHNVNTRHYRNGVRRLLRAVSRLDVPQSFHS